MSECCCRRTRPRAPRPGRTRGRPGWAWPRCNASGGGSSRRASRRRPYREGGRTYGRKLDGGQEAHLIALACWAPPEGCGRWRLRLLARRMVELEHVDALSHETVRQTLKKNEPKPHLRRMVAHPAGEIGR